MNIQDFTDQLFKKAEQAGFTEYEAYCALGTSFSVNVQDGEPEKYTVNSFSGLSFRVKQNGRIGYCSTTSLDAEMIDFLIQGAQRNLSVLDSEDEQFIFEGSPQYTKVDGWSKELAAITDAEKIDMARCMETTAKAQAGIARVMQAVVAYGEEETFIRNSKGLNLSQRENYMYAYCIAIATDETVQSDGMAYAFAANGTKLIDAQAIGTQAASKALQKLHPSKIATGDYGLILNGEAFSDLITCFDTVFSADAAQKGLSLLAGKEGQMVASSVLSIYDDPLSAFVPMRQGFDDEGVATSTKAIIENGKLCTLLHNLKTAHKAGVHSTGNARKSGYAGSVSISPTCFYVKPSQTSSAALLEQMGDGLYLTELVGLHSGANAASGDFSLSAKGFRVRQGKMAEAIADLTISGNFYEVLRTVKGVSDTIIWGLPGGGMVGSPDVWIDKIMASGE